MELLVDFFGLPYLRRLVERYRPRRRGRKDWTLNKGRERSESPQPRAPGRLSFRPPRPPLVQTQPRAVLHPGHRPPTPALLSIPRKAGSSGPATSRRPRSDATGPPSFPSGCPPVRRAGKGRGGRSRSAGPGPPSSEPAARVWAPRPRRRAHAPPQRRASSTSPNRPPSSQRLENSPSVTAPCGSTASAPQEEGPPRKGPCAAPWPSPPVRRGAAFGFTEDLFQWTS